MPRFASTKAFAAARPSSPGRRINTRADCKHLNSRPNCRSTPTPAQQSPRMHAKSSRQTGSLSLLALSACLSGGSGFAFADTDLFFSELPTVASISRLPQRQADAPASVTVIDRAMIRASGARSLSDVFRLVPGFQTHAASDASARVNYHGVADNDHSPRAQVLVDGRSLHSPLSRSGVNWSLIPVALEDIDRIEVVRGSNTTSYGTNAFLGVINIVTIDPALAHGASLSVSRGNQGVRDHTLRGAVSLSEETRVRITFQQQRDDGLEERADGNRFSNWKDRNRSKLLDLRLQHQLDFSNTLEMGLGRVESLRLTGRRDPGTGVPEGLDPLRNLEESSTWLQLRWLQARSDSSDLSLRYTYSDDRANARFDAPAIHPALEALIGKPYSPIDTNGDRGTRHEIELAHTALLGSQFRTSSGASWRRDTLYSDTTLRDRSPAHRSVSRLFLNTEWRPTNWFTGNAGASVEHDSLAGRHFAPRASAAFHILPEHTVRLGYSRAWRTPSILEYRGRSLITPKLAYSVGNRDLPAERLDSWELGYLGHWPEARTSLDVRVFSERLRNRLQDLIKSSETFGFLPFPAANDTPYTVEPIQNLHTRGYELQWKWQPLDGTRLSIAHANIRVSVRDTARGRSLQLDPAGNYQSGYERYRELAERSAPRRSTSVLLTQALPAGADLSVAWYRVGDIKWTRGTFAPGYERFDLRVAHPLRVGSQHGEVAYTAQSLKGAHFEQREQRVVDRRHWVTLRLDF